MSASWPRVAVIMPVRDEAAGLKRAVAAVLAQDYPGPLEVCLAVASSTDGTEAVAARLAGEHAAVRVVANPAGTTPTGLNAAVRATGGDVVVRVDGHAELTPGYVRRAVETLQRTRAVNVGGVQRAIGTTPFESAVAAAMSSPFGVGDARFHYGGGAGPVDTVYLGVYDRRALVAAGMFDERLVRNQDYELNIRLRAAGGTVWFDPGLSVNYRPRSSWRALARQYREYGEWKFAVVRAHPRALRWRQVVPPLTTIAVTAGLTGHRVWRPALIAPATYAATVAVASVVTGRTPGRIARLLAVFPTMHLAWGAGFLGAAARHLVRRPTARSAARIPGSPAGGAGDG